MKTINDLQQELTAMAAGAFNVVYQILEHNVPNYYEVVKLDGTIFTMPLWVESRPDQFGMWYTVVDSDSQVIASGYLSEVANKLSYNYLRSFVTLESEK